MSPFEYAMVLISIIVGLGITHILSGLGAAVHRLRGHGPPIHLEIAYLAWVGFIFSQLLFFWWWEFKWSELVSEFGVGLFLFLVLYAVSLFSLAVILVPHQLSVVDDSWEYFLSIRGWFYGGLLVMNAIDLADTFMKGVDWGGVYGQYGGANLDADDLGTEVPALGDAHLEAVEAHVDDAHRVALGLETAGDALEPQGLDERQHLQSQDPSVRRLHKG